MGRPPLDPFVFPSETRGRFRMLAVAALLTALNLGFILTDLTSSPPDPALQNELRRLYRETLRGRDPRDLSPEEIRMLSRRLPPMGRELFRQQTRRMVLPVAAALALLAGAALVYLDHPRRLRRRHDARPLTAEQVPSVSAALHGYAERFGIPGLRLELSPKGFLEGQAFGPKGREALLLHGEPELLERSWGDVGATVALHEMGHLVNGDAQDREKARAVWISLMALLALGLCTLAVLAAAGKTRIGLREIGPLLLAQSGRLAVTLALVWAIWAGLIRVRELYADRRVVSWGYQEALSGLLEVEEERSRWWHRWQGWEPLAERWGERPWLRKAATLSFRAWERMEDLWRRHPSQRLRREVLQDPDRLFRISPDLALITGLLLTLLIANLIAPLRELAGSLSQRMSAELWSSFAAIADLPLAERRQVMTMRALLFNVVPIFLLASTLFAVLSYFVASALGVQVQREAVADLAQGKHRSWGYLKLLSPAVLLALGLEAGLLFTPFSPIAPAMARPATLPFWFAGFTLGTWLWLCYVRALTRFTLGLHIGFQVPRRLQTLSTVSATLLLTILFWPAAFTRLTLDLEGRSLPADFFPGDNPKVAFTYLFFFTAVYLTAAAGGLYVLWAGVSHACVSISLLRRRPHCQICGDPGRGGFVIGRSCEHCGSILAPWAHAHTKPSLERSSTS